jgi:hypothetical protein
MNRLGRVASKEVFVELPDEALRLLAVGTFEADHDCPLLSHWSSLILLPPVRNKSSEGYTALPLEQDIAWLILHARWLRDILWRVKAGADEAIDLGKR